MRLTRDFSPTYATQTTIDNCYAVTIKAVLDELCKTLNIPNRTNIHKISKLAGYRFISGVGDTYFAVYNLNQKLLFKLGLEIKRSINTSTTLIERLLDNRLVSAPIITFSPGYWNEKASGYTVDGNKETELQHQLIVEDISGNNIFLFDTYSNIGDGNPNKIFNKPTFLRLWSEAMNEVTWVEKKGSASTETASLLSFNNGDDRG
jgi:hypothetical protein